MAILTNYDNFFLPADDLEQAKEFYIDTLELETKFDFSDMGMTAFKVGDNEPAIILSTRPQAQPAIWFTVENVSQAYHTLKQKGVSFLGAPFEIATGWAVEFNDPFGNRLGLTDYSKTKATSNEV